MSLRKTKIICTLGPVVDNEDMMRQLILAGMDAARFNFSHGSHEEQYAKLCRFQRVRDAMGRPIATILDTKGPEVRIKSFAGGNITLMDGNTFTLTTEDIIGDNTQVSVTYKDLHTEMAVGAHILVDDGLIDLLVEKIEGQNIICTVVNGGSLSNNKSLNFPNTAIKLPALTEKDKEDLKFAVENDFDYIAASFVRRASDVVNIRETLDSYGGQDIRIIAKIENLEGVENLDEIIQIADGLMVARGDLGVEVEAHRVPILQKEMIAKCINLGKPVITATQMMDSMMRNPRPTRAEVSDVANAVFDGTSCIMLSGETASGKYPIEAVRIMADIALATEESIHYWKRFAKKTYFVPSNSISDAISHSCCTTAMDLGANTILVATQSGHSARVISRFRPACTIAAFTTTERVRRQLAISWGVHPYLCGSVDSTDRMFSLCIESALKENVVVEGETVVITAGVSGRPGSTNLIKAQIVEKLI